MSRAHSHPCVGSAKLYPISVGRKKKMKQCFNIWQQRPLPLSPLNITTYIDQCRYRLLKNSNFIETKVCFWALSKKKRRGFLLGSKSIRSKRICKYFQVQRLRTPRDRSSSFFSADNVLAANFRLSLIDDLKCFPIFLQGCQCLA